MDLSLEFMLVSNTNASLYLKFTVFQCSLYFFTDWKKGDLKGTNILSILNLGSVLGPVSFPFSADSRSEFLKDVKALGDTKVSIVPQTNVIN